MKEIARIRIAAQHVRSLTWRGDMLADLVAGDRHFNLDGSLTEAFINWGFRFDQVVVSPSGRYSVIYADAGTKGLVLEGLRIVREINRSYSHADRYKYPVTLLSGPGGGELLAHCPDGYNRIELAGRGNWRTPHASGWRWGGHLPFAAARFSRRAVSAERPGGSGTPPAC